MFDGTSNEPTFEMMQEEGIFPRLLELIEEWNAGKNPLLQRMLLILLYEMARMQRLTREDLSNANDMLQKQTKGARQCLRHLHPHAPRHHRVRVQRRVRPVPLP